jgi:hypothetical protein
MNESIKEQQAAKASILKDKTYLAIREKQKADGT